MRRRAIPLILALCLTLLIAVTSALPTATKHALHTQGALHPWLHLAGFALLAFLLLSSTRSDLIRVVFVLALLGLGYATEAYESRKDGWPIEAKDVRTDTIGVLVGTIAGLLRFPKNTG